VNFSPISINIVARKNHPLNMLNNEIKNQHPNDIAEMLESFEEGKRFLTFLMLPKNLKSEVFSYLTSSVQQEIILELGTTKAAELLESMAPDDRTAVFESFPDELIKESVNLLSDKEKNIALNLLGYPEECIARLMTPYYVQVKPEWTIKRTLDHIKRYGKKAETLNFVYVVDNHNKLIDDIQIGKLLMADEEKTIESIADYNFQSLVTTMSKEDAISYFDKYDRSALPVVTEEGVLVGIVTFDDIFDEIEKVNTEDFQKLGAVEALDLSYTETPLLTLVNKRVIWLVVLFLGQLLTVSAITFYEAKIETAFVLTLFIPLVISAGGNTGSQAATLIVRAMAIKELGIADWLYVLRKELLSGLLLGGILGVLGFSRVLIWHNLGLYDYGEYWFFIGLTIGLALVLIVMWGTVTGSMIPFVLKRFGLDPATSSAPFVATLVDVTGLVIYFSMALAILSGKLL
jgi:magnesium transporter